MENNLVFNTKAIVEVTKEFTFDSAHFLKKYKGKCANLHGHTYRLQVTFKGICGEIGIVVDFNTLKVIVNDGIVKMLDHKVLNDVLDFNTTAENMCVWIYEELSTFTKCNEHDIKITSVKLWETPTSYAEYKGEVSE